MVSAKWFGEKDASISPLKNKKIAVLGFGSQGSAQALNLRDSGLDVIVGVRAGKSKERARKEGFEVLEVADATAQADVVLFLLPDEEQPAVYEKEIAANLRKGAVLVFAHGMNVVFSRIKPRADVDVVLCTSIGPGKLLRGNFAKGGGLMGLIAVEKDVSGGAKKYALAIAKGIGLLRVGVLETTMREETVVDLFGEQAVLCGGIAGAMKHAFAELVAKGYPAELAYMFCVQGAASVTELIEEHGIEGMYERVSNTAEFGSRFFGERAAEKGGGLKELLHNIEEGRFAKEWAGEHAKGMDKLKGARQAGKRSMIEKTGREVRSHLNKKV
ncbi:MAG: ketol-acid reductoisomerase [Candidatus Diapherotrites archaeon]|nr:ketol-acid reductoisomerase [Candidatus Micrarchaeota archaeon]